MRRLVGVLSVVAAACVLSWYTVVDFDVFWHIKTGELILETGRLPRTNTFSSLFPDHPWPNPEWLFQVLLALVHRSGGWLGVQVFKVSLVAATGLTLWAVLRRRGLGPIWAAGVAVVPLAAMQYRFTERPQLFSYWFFVAVIGIADRARRGSRRALWLLPPLFALWSNIHPEVFIGILYLGAVAVGLLLNNREVPGAGRSAFVPFAAAIAACAVGTLLNPEGWHVLAFPILHLFLGPTIDVTEYSFSTPAAVPLFWILLLATLPLLARGRERRDWAELIPAAGLGLLGVIYLRDTPYFLLTAAPALADYILAADRPGVWFTRSRAGLTVCLAVAGSLLWALGLDRNQPYRWGWGVDERFYPIAAADVLRAHPFRGPLYNHYGDGGYLIDRLYPHLGVFQDGRVQAYPRDFIARLNARFTPEAWPGIVRDYGVSVALVRAREAKPPYFSAAEWGIVFWDDDWVLLVRRGTPDAALLAALEYRVFLPGVDYRVIDDQALLRRLADEMARNQRERLRPSAGLARALAGTRQRIEALQPAPAASLSR